MARHDASAQRALRPVILALVAAIGPGPARGQSYCLADTSGGHDHLIHGLPAYKATPAEIDIPLAFHIFHKVDGYGDVLDSQLDEQMEILNDGFASTRFRFHIALVRRVAADAYFSSFPDPESAWALDTDRVINVFVGDFPNNDAGWSVIPGSAFAPSDRDDWVVKLDFATIPGGVEHPLAADFSDGGTLVHEIGHYLGLYHTFEGQPLEATPDKQCNYVVDAGDFVANTPPHKQPGLGGCQTKDTCPNDGEGDPKANFMNYTSDACRSEFTSGANGQIRRMDDEVFAHHPDIWLNSGVVEIDSDLVIASNQRLLIKNGETVVFDGTGLTILAGASVDVEGGATLNFGAGRGITVYGTLNLLGTSASNMVTMAPRSSTWAGIYFSSGGTGLVQYSALSGVSTSAGGAAVRTAGETSTVRIENSTITVVAGSYVFGVADSGSSASVGAKIYQSTITSASGPALYTTGSAGYVAVHDSEIWKTGSYPAVRTEGGTAIAWLPGEQSHGYNEIWGGRLHASGNGIINFGEHQYGKAYNRFCDAAASSLEADTGGYVLARYDYWYQNQAPAQNNHGGTGSISYGYPQNATPTCGAAKGFVPLEGSSPGVVSAPESDLFRAFALEHDGKLDEALALFLEVARAGQDPDASAALLEYGRLARTLKRPDAVEALRILSAYDAVRTVKAERVLAPLLASLGRFDEALSLLESLEKEYAGTADGFFATLDRIYLLIELDRSNEAVSLLNGIQTRTDEETLALAAVTWQLRADGYDAVERALADPDREGRVAVDDTGGLEATAYPSPFNPTTTVVFDLAGRTSVDVAVYDALGRRLASLARGVFEAGRHETSWNATGHPSGMYFIVIRAGGALRTLPVTLSK